VTIHRAANTDDPDRFKQITAALNDIPETVVFPVHPRTRGVIEKNSVQLRDHILQLEPVGYYDMLVLENNAHRIATDSGGVQREAYYLKKPCITLRDETEWAEIVHAGWNKIAGASCEQILDAWLHFNPPAEHPNLYGNGKAAQQIAEILAQNFVPKGTAREIEPSVCIPNRSGDNLR